MVAHLLRLVAHLLPRSAPDAPTQHPAMPNGKVGKVEKLEATVAQQQKQIETLTAQADTAGRPNSEGERLKAQASKPALQVVKNNQ